MEAKVIPLSRDEVTRVLRTLDELNLVYTSIAQRLGECVNDLTIQRMLHERVQMAQVINEEMMDFLRAARFNEVQGSMMRHPSNRIHWVGE